MSMTTSPLDPPIGAELLEQLGFLHVPGGRAGRAAAYLFVCLRKRPTLAHYDPEAVRFWVTSDGRGIAEELSRNTPMPVHTDFSWGTFRLVDRLGVSNHYVSFGGDLSADRVAGSVVGVFRSPAPLLLRGGHSQGWDLGAESIAAFFARLRAACGAVPGLEPAVAEASPLTLYAAFLADAMARYRSTEILRTLDSPLWRWLDSEGRQMRQEQPADWDAGARLAVRAGLGQPAG
jgi:hypothetical protein